MTAREPSVTLRQPGRPTTDPNRSTSRFRPGAVSSQPLRLSGYSARTRWFLGRRGRPGRRARYAARVRPKHRPERRSWHDRDRSVFAADLLPGIVGEEAERDTLATLERRIGQWGGLWRAHGPQRRVRRPSAVRPCEESSGRLWGCDLGGGCSSPRERSSRPSRTTSAQKVGVQT